MSLIEKIWYQLLAVDRFRFYVCKVRIFFLRENIKFENTKDEAVLSYAISHNLSALDQDCAFGMEKRMSLVLYPSAALLRENIRTASCLLVGPRTEDDIFWAWSLGFRQARGLDLFSYSPYIDIGDMHRMKYDDNSFDLIILGWVLAYSSDPMSAVAECLRVCKPGGYLAIGMDSISNFVYDPTHPVDKVGYTNQFKNIEEVSTYVKELIVFKHQEAFKENGHAYSSIIFQKRI